VKLTQECLKSFEKEVILRYPEEACGFVVGGQFVACKNIAADPLKHFKISDEDYLAAAKTGELQAVLHSHPYNLNDKQKWPPEWPSANDMKHQIISAIPWGICCTDGGGISQLVWLGDPPPPLEGREFVHGITDCYSLCRDYYKTKGIELPDFPRDMEWWEKGQDLYSENFAKIGFKEIPPSEVREGDAVLIGVGSPVINHAGIVVGPNRMLHHLFNRFSGVDAMNKWERKIAKYLRYVG
jgi:proteasome lid subunit RPN8/RPN11